MIVKSLKINNLRNIESVSITPGAAINVFFGDNGAGKTSILEALVVLAKGKSFRSGQIAALLGPHQDHFQVITSIGNAQGREHQLGFERHSDRWSARMNGQDVTRLSELSARVPLVLLEPNSHLLISGPPEGRRRFLDWGVFHVEHRYLETWRRYMRAVKQRNAALRKRKAAVVASLDPILAELGTDIHCARLSQYDQLRDRLPEIIDQLSPELPATTLGYDRGWREPDLAEALQRARERDMVRGATGPGPHRADLSFDVDQQAARERLSRGEQKILSAALVFCQAVLMAENGDRPLLLLDDLASEFDGNHLQAVMTLAQSLQAQAWVTGTSAAPYENIPAENLCLFHVEHGRVTAA